MDMGRFNGEAKEEDQGESALVPDLAKASEAGQSPCGLGLGNALPKKDLASAVRVFRAPGCAAEPLTTITAILPGFKWSCLLLRCVLQDALSEVTKFYPPLKLRVFVDDITALLMGKNKAVVEMAKKVMKKVTEDGKEGQSKMIASCGFLENELRQFSKEEGVTLADSVDTLGVDLRTRVKKFGAKAKSEEEEVRGEIFDHKEE